MRLLLALPLALTLCAGAMAKDRDKDFDREAAVETLRASIPSGYRFEVEDVRAGNDGFACVTYQTGKDQDGQEQVRALVKGDQVLRESNRYVRFEKAWLSKCAGA